MLLLGFEVFADSLLAAAGLERRLDHDSAADAVLQLSLHRLV